MEPFSIFPGYMLPSEKKRKLTLRQIREGANQFVQRVVELQT